MDKKKIHIDWQLFRKAVAGQLHSEEKIKLDAWLQADAKNQKYFQKAQAYFQIKTSDEFSKIDYRPAFDQFIAQTTKKDRSYLRMFQVAASIILLLASGWLAYVVITAEDYQRLSDAKPIHVKEGQVELVLSTGKRVLLDKKGESNIKEREGEIQKKDGLVNYLAFEGKKQKYTQYNTINVPRGSDFKLVLSDSTVVWLNAESSITYPIQFAGNIRKVNITGEAYFDVTPDKSTPFVVESGNTQIEVLGTEFNINAYKGDAGIFTTLIEGSVAIDNGFGKQAVIKPNEQAITNSSAHLEVRKVDVNRVLDWRNGMFDFEDETLEDILEELARWYDFKIFYESEELKSYEFTGGIDRYKDMNQLLQLFEMTKSVNFYLKEDVLLVKKAN
ncbi:FecR domain-containing protein [Ancylomarina sp. DW003]|nr:FecR family protein [Ancylomarina sp. DW003]MDE5421098.1 FecR domain-containing protein [Ancylomarina sp. DW003]